MKIYTPANEYQPEYLDGVENLLTRQGRTQTQSTTAETLGTIELVPGLFSIAPNNKLTLQAFGRFIGAAGGKTLIISLDGVTTLLNTGVLPSNNQAWFIDGHLMFDGANLFWAIYFRNGSNPSPFTPVGQSAAFNSGVAFNPSAAHSLVIQGLVANAADTVSLDWFGASFR